MKKKNRIAQIFLTVFFVSIIVLFTGLTCYAADKEGLVGKGDQSEQSEEMLVASDVDFAIPVWCGQNALVVGGRFGLRWTDFLTKKLVKISSGAYDEATDCTSDGKWVLYSDKHSARYDKGTEERGVVDFWRFNLKTHQRQKFAVAVDGSKAKWSPGGKKLLFDGSKPRSFMEQPSPRWELIWTRTGGSGQWLADSSGVVSIHNNKIYVERINEGLIQSFNIDLGHIMHLNVDKANRIYLISRAKPDFKKAQLLRCMINGNTLQCESPLKRDNSVLEYDITVDGEQIVFLKQGNTCAWHIKSGSAEAKCVVQNVGPIVSISPDGKWLAFIRHRKIGEQSGKDIVEADLYVTKLESK